MKKHAQTRERNKHLQSNEKRIDNARRLSKRLQQTKLRLLRQKVQAALIQRRMSWRDYKIRRKMVSL